MRVIFLTKFSMLFINIICDKSTFRSNSRHVVTSDTASFCGSHHASSVHGQWISPKLWNSSEILLFFCLLLGSWKERWNSKMQWKYHGVEHSILFHFLWFVRYKMSQTLTGLYKSQLVSCENYTGELLNQMSAFLVTCIFS